MIDWDTLKRSDAKKIKAVMRHARECVRDYGIPVSVLDLEMSLVACHTNGQELNLAKLESFGDTDLLHDILGIHKNLNKETGELENCFVPRCVR